MKKLWKKILYMRLYLCLLLMITLSFVGCSNDHGATDKHEVFPDQNQNEAEIDDVDPVSVITEKKEYSDDYYVKWAVPESVVRYIKEEWVEKFNDKLESEGYNFGLMLVGLDDSIFDFGKYGIDHYLEELETCKADIVYTGDELDSYENRVEKDMAEGKYLDLTDFISNGKLKNVIPEKLLNSISYSGKIYLLPSETCQDGSQLEIRCLKDTEIKMTIPDNLEESLLELNDMVSSDNKLYYGWNDMWFVNCLGYYYDYYNYVVVDKEGNIINPLEDEKCIKWLRMLNEWYKKGYAPNPYDGNVEDIKKECSFFLYASNVIKKPDEIVISSWRKNTCKRYKASTAIRADSDNKDNALRLLEILRTNSDYGNILVFGKEYDENEKIIDAYNIKSILGIDVGIMHNEDGLMHFNNHDERMAFYEENVILSPLIDVEFPDECRELGKIIEKYLFFTNNIVFKENFEENLETFRKEYTETLKRIMAQMMASG